MTEKTPVLGNVPVLGRLFRRTYERMTSRSCLIFITPRILPADGEIQQEGEDA